MTGPSSTTGAPSALSNQEAGSTLHVCHNYRQLLHAMIDARRTAEPATIVYLQDDLPVPENVQEPLSQHCPSARLVFVLDRDMADRFANLPNWLPAIARRNVRFPVNGGALPRQWRPPEFSGQHFGTGYIYHPGFFSAKMLAGLCDLVVMRESGMNNYIELSVPAFKGFLRALTGMSARRQIWGEERWIDEIEVEMPDMLPQPVRHKARKMRFADVLQSDQSGLIRDVVKLLAPSVDEIEIPHGSALMLTQPIDELGLCSTTEKQAIYGYLAEALSLRGFQVFVKNHPRERSYSLSGARNIPHGFPIEAWALVHPDSFTLAIALHSASLAQTGAEFATRKIQLFDGLAIDCVSLDDWQQLISERLDRCLEGD